MSAYNYKSVTISSAVILCLRSPFRSCCCTLLNLSLYRQFTRRQLRFLQRQLDDPIPDIIRDAVPKPGRPGRTVFQRLRPTQLVFAVPAIEGGGAGNAQPVQRAFGRPSAHVCIHSAKIVGERSHAQDERPIIS